MSESCDSFVTDLLSKYNIQLEKEDVGVKAEQITRQLEDTKHELLCRLEKTCGECSESIMKTNNLFGQVEEIHSKAKDIKMGLVNQITLIKELSPAEHDSLAAKFEKTNLILLLLSHIKVINSLVHLLQRHIDTNSFFEAAKSIMVLEDLKRNGPVEEFSKCSRSIMPKCLFQMYSLQEQLDDNLKVKLKNVFSSRMTWVIDVSSNKVKLTFSDLCDKELWSEAVRAMNELNLLDAEVSSFSDFIMPHVFEKITSGSHPSIENCSLAVVDFSSRQDSVVSRQQEANRIVEDMNEVLCFLQRNLKLEGSGDDENMFLRVLGGQISSTVFRLLFHDIIQKAIPSSSNELQGFRNLLSTVGVLQNNAQMFDFLEGKKDFIKEFIGDAEMAFVVKKCEDLVIGARCLLREPLHEVVDVGVAIGDVMRDGYDDDGDMESCHMPKLDLLPMFFFPKCQISKSTEKLWHQLENLISHFATDRLNCSREAVVHIYKSIHKVLQLFIDVSPLQHHQAIQSLALIAAVHHNNCMYLAHETMLLEMKLKQNFPHLPPTSSFIDLVPVLREMGTSSFLSLLSLQRSEIVEELKLLNGCENISDEVHFECVSKSVKKVSLKLHHLNNAWKSVLPESVCQKAIGALYESSLDEVIGQIVKLEDISEDDGQQLVSILSSLEQLGMELFSHHDCGDDDDNVRVSEVVLQKHVDSWIRLKELKFVLNARLLEIRDRWASGKGPLADQFTSEELDNLVRALFQNTEMRSAILATISRH